MLQLQPLNILYRMKRPGNLISLFSILSLFLLFVNLYAEINLQFTTQRHFPNPRYAGLANAGVAIPEAVSGTMLNPSLVHSWHWNNKTQYSALVTYEKDSVFSHIVTTGVSWYINEKTTLGTIYRYLENGDDNFQNEAVLCIAGRLFDKSLDQGAVNLGVNIRFEDLNWKSSDLDSLTTLHIKYKGTILDTTHDTTIINKYPPVSKERFIEEKRLLFDLGFFQDNIFPDLDFGLTFHNLFGYVWKSEKPNIKHIKYVTYDSTIVDAMIIDSVDSSYYITEWEDSNGKNKKVYKRMTVGLSYHVDIMQNKVMILIPFDLEFIALFDRKQDMKLGFHTGIEGWLNNKICLRFGYARSPNSISGKPGDITLSNDNIFSGGASVRFENVGFDVYIRDQNWGVGSAIAF